MRKEDFLAEIVPVLESMGLDGWLLYDFRGLNPLAHKVLGLPGDNLLTRRWFAWIPVRGEPVVVVHEIEAGNHPSPWKRLLYSDRYSLIRRLSQVLEGSRRIAMEFSPMGDNPYLSRVDGGTLDLLRSLGLEVVSSGDLLQRFLAWTPEQMEGHRKAASALSRVKDRALCFLRSTLERGEDVFEHEVQRYLLEAMAKEGLMTNHPPIVAFGNNAANPHYQPRIQSSRALRRGEVVLLDLWGKLPGPMPYADITWMACWGPPAPEVNRAFAAVLEARDRCVDFLRGRLQEKQDVRGWEVDEVARAVLRARGYGGTIKHRTGHSLGIEEVHGEAVHFDSMETLDERKILAGLGFTVEPGVYPGPFGIRSEINILVHASDVEVTTQVQTDLELL